MRLGRSLNTVMVMKAAYGQQHHPSDLSGRLAQVDYLVLASPLTTPPLPHLLMTLNLRVPAAESEVVYSCHYGCLG